MRIALPDDLNDLSTYIRPMLDLVGADRWFRRAEHFASEVGRSRYRWKIVSDYHWLEMGIAFQAEVLEKEGRLSAQYADALILAALNFAGTCVEIHRQLTPAGRLALEGRLRDAIKSDVGFAPLYLELDLAQRLMDAGYDVDFPDLEGQARYDLLFYSGAFSGEVECKSLSPTLAARSIAATSTASWRHSSRRSTPGSAAAVARSCSLRSTPVSRPMTRAGPPS
jgi:hypothetical protein